MHSIYWIDEHGNHCLDDTLYQSYDDVAKKLIDEGYYFEDGCYKKDEAVPTKVKKALITQLKLCHFPHSLTKEREKELETLIDELHHELISLAKKAENIIFFKKSLYASLANISGKLSHKKEVPKLLHQRSIREFELELIVSKVSVALVMLKELLRNSPVVDNTFHRTLKFVIKETSIRHTE